MSTLKNASVVIVGAGISGLACAVKLFQHGFQNLTILEARNRCGGRIHSISTDDFVFEAGAQWLQDGLDEMVKKLSNGNKIELIRVADEVACFFEDEAKSSDKLAVIKAAEFFYEMFDAADTTTMPLDNILTFLQLKWEKYIRKNINLQKSLFASLFEILCQACRECDGVQSLADAKVLSGYEKIGDERTQIKGSLSLLINSLMKSLPSDIIKYEHEVVSIKWNQNGSRNRVEVSCLTASNQQRQFSADHVVVTLPLGVLKNQHKNLFFPSLNEAKITAIDRMGYSFVNKVILYYDKPFWNKGRAQVLYIPKTFGTGLWDSIVCFYFEEDLENEKSYVCLDYLPVPKFMHVTKWAGDPYSCGSYSYMAVQSSSEDLKELTKPLPVDGSPSSLQLLFAGEATHEKYFSTIHGGYYSGVREAERLINHYSETIK